jgi:hypothetical protein
MAETTNLTTTITSEEYARLLYKIGQADRLAEAVAADWLASTGFSFNKPSDATLEALRRYDGILHHETEEKVNAAEEKNVADLIDKQPTIPVLFPDCPGVPSSPITPDDNPLRIEVGDRFYLDPKIT